MYINNALLHDGYSSFSLSIIENIHVSGLSLEEVRKLILEREQFYLDLIFFREMNQIHRIFYGQLVLC